MLLMLTLFVGCTEKARTDALRTLSKQATAQFKVNRGFHVIDGQPVYLDSNASEGKITRQLPNVDAPSFRALPTPPEVRVFYAVDGKHAYIAMHYNVTELPHADGASFELFLDSYAFARDKEHVFYLGVAIDGADPSTFTPLTTCFAKDATQAYIGTIPIAVTDIASWRPLGEGSAEDPWYRSAKDTHARPHSELNAFGWSQDDSSVYWGSDLVGTADTLSFVRLGKFYGKDAKNVYYAGKPIAGTDPASFELVDPPPIGLMPDATDKNRSYKYGEPQ